MVMRPDRRSVLLAGGATIILGGQRQPAAPKIELWDNATGPHLRGAVFPQRRVYPEIDGDTFLGPGPVGTPISSRALASLAEAGGNLALLSHPGVFRETPPYRLDPEIEDHLAELVERSARHGLFSVIGFRTGPGRSEFTFHRDDGGSWFPTSMIDERIWSSDEAQGAWVEMCRHTARQFGSTASVAGFLPMVEPNGSHVVSRSPWSEFARRLAMEIRAVDAQLPVLISPDGYANSMNAKQLDLSDIPNLVMAVHDYSPYAYTHGEPMSAASFSDAEANIASPDFPRWMAGEYGVRRWAANAARYLDLRLQSIEQYGANSTFFHWPSGWENYEAVENGWNPFFGSAPAATRRSNTAPLVDVLNQYWSRNRARP
jgi:Cellulase (glycosyl hydrolase family 5)